MIEQTKPVGLHLGVITQDKLKKIAARENKTMSRIVEELVLDYIKKHGDGNPVYSLDKWGNPDFIPVPAFMEDWQRWRRYLKQCDRKELEIIEARAAILKKEAGEIWRSKRN